MTKYARKHLHEAVGVASELLECHSGPWTRVVSWMEGMARVWYWLW